MWLRDSLPQDLENAQVYLYGYDSHLSNSQSFQGIVALATTLRQRLQRLRISEQKERPVPRPLMFIAHSLGGILVKEVGTSFYWGPETVFVIHIETVADYPKGYCADARRPK